MALLRQRSLKMTTLIGLKRLKFRDFGFAHVVKPHSFVKGSKSHFKRGSLAKPHIDISDATNLVLISISFSY